MRTLNEQLGMGGTHRDLVKFELHWHYNLDTIIDILNNRDDLPQDYKQEIEDCPRVAHTLSQELDTIPPSRMETRAHVPAQPTMRYKQFDALGNGSFGTVFKGLDLDLGRFMAIKRLEQPSDPEGAAQFQQSLRYAAKREVETLSRIKHPHIVKFYHSQGWETPSVKIFMELKEGSLGLLARRPDWPDRALHTSQLVLQQMLQALDFLAFNDVVHRDVKPENILYSSPRGTQDYTFQLGDFGLCNQSSHSTSVVGTNEFMAPEVYEGEKQSSKVDVWSLAVTLLWILDTNGFRQTFRTPIGRKPYQNEIVRAAQTYNSNVLQHMTRIDANYRATAAQLLATYFNGEGLTTRAQIPQITEPMDL
ncbi:MAG: hypothetical protein LQ344_007680 [Seirophora lacunosa]|nr:MAG: hypothetical protein LQ344_007680 [Seirophora lacunosa]